MLTFSPRLLEDEKDIAPNVVVLKLLLTKTSQAIPSLPAGVNSNKAVIVDLNIVAQDWQDDHTWTKTRASKKKVMKSFKIPVEKYLTSNLHLVELPILWSVIDILMLTPQTSIGLW